MLNEQISFSLPLPWTDLEFSVDQVGAINYLVGPNGSGKSRFASRLLELLKGRPGGARLLGTDRLKEMADPGITTNFWGDNYGSGYPRQQFHYLRQAGTVGSGIDTIVLLEERMDLRIQIEATLSHLFDRDITLDWDSGNLIPLVAQRDHGETYRLDREECHGIKELMVLLTHLYDEQNRHLIIDEPELNLHPQLQAFFIQEVCKVTGETKVVFLITHSPFILDLRSEDDLKSLMSFDLGYSAPKQVASLNLNLSSPAFSLARLNAHHKQLFFSDSPVFVEGPHDAGIVASLLEARGTSVAGAGSCIIDAGGVEEVNRYLELCQGLGKEAHFVYDLDSLFRGKLRRCIGDDETVQSFLASAGLGDDFAKAFSPMEQDLRQLLMDLHESDVPDNLQGLADFLNTLGETAEWGKEVWSKARVAVLTAISLYEDDVAAATSQSKVDSVKGRMNQILAALRAKNVHVLPGGTLERYLPEFMGNVYEPSPESKQNTVDAELRAIRELSTHSSPDRDEELAERYGELYEIVCRLPSKSEVDVDPVLRWHLSDYVHELQKIAKSNPNWQFEQIQSRLSRFSLSKSGVVSLECFERAEGDEFCATIGIIPMLGSRARVLLVDQDTTYANMNEFEPAYSSSEVES